MGFSEEVPVSPPTTCSTKDTIHNEVPILTFEDPLHLKRDVSPVKVLWFQDGWPAKSLLMVEKCKPVVFRGRLAGCFLRGSFILLCMHLFPPQALSLFRNAQTHSRRCSRCFYFLVPGFQLWESKEMHGYNFIMVFADKDISQAMSVDVFHWVAAGNIFSHSPSSVEIFC